MTPARSPGLANLLALSVALAACNALPGATVAAQPAAPGAEPQGQPAADPPPPGLAVAIFAGGCFWCMEGPFESLPGVTEVLSGYCGGPEPHPTYHQVGGGNTGHAEAVRVVYDPAKISYDALLDRYWRAVDPTDGGGQFHDRGTQYRPAVFYRDAAQKAAAEASRDALARSGKFRDPIAVRIEPATTFWVAEGYHQDYYKTHSLDYLRYRNGSGRAGFLRETWGEDVGHP